jgi:hypothetical protein
MAPRGRFVNRRPGLRQRVFSRLARNGRGTHFVFLLRRCRASNCAGGAYIALFTMYAVKETHTWQNPHVCATHGWAGDTR